jgi:F0F1-type ATP synthase alpha subunit
VARLQWGQYNTIDSNFATEGASTIEVSLTGSLPKVEFSRQVNKEQLVSGHLRVDLLRPMTKGNLIVLKGHRNTGKTQFAASLIKNFVNENPGHNKAVYVGMSSHGREI